MPDGTKPGIYKGPIVIKAGSYYLGEVDLEIEVMPIELIKSPLTYSIWYKSMLYGNNEETISNWKKTTEQIKAEFADLAAHGVLYPSAENHWGANQRANYFNLRTQQGIENDPLYYAGILIDPRFSLR